MDYSRWANYDEYNAWKAKRRKAQGKVCVATTFAKYANPQVVPCRLPALYEHEGKKYCWRHYPPNIEERRQLSLKRREARLRRQLIELRGQLGNL